MDLSAVDALAVDMDLKHLGARSEMIAAVWLLERGYEVFRNVSSAGPIDLVAVDPTDRDGTVYLFDVKSEMTQGTSLKSRSTIQQKIGVRTLIVERWNQNDCRIQGEFSHARKTVSRRRFFPQTLPECTQKRK
jgi:Holliday junction resolvase-like predicted endonuclease